jgi:hypothetical protein
MDSWKDSKNDTELRSTSNMEKLALLQLITLIILHKWRHYDSSVKSMSPAISLTWTKLAYTGRELLIAPLLHSPIVEPRRAKTVSLLHLPVMLMAVRSS